MDMPVIARNTANDLKGHHLAQSELSQLYLPTFFRSFYSKNVSGKGLVRDDLKGFPAS